MKITNYSIGDALLLKSGTRADELLIINTKEGKVEFEVGSGRIVEAGKIVGAMSKALFLFSKKIIKENIHFVRFEKQRMIFISSPRRPELCAVKLVSKSILARDFVPAMSITLNVMVERLETGTFDEKTRPILADFYNLLTNIDKTLILARNTKDDITSLITLLSGIVYDLGVSMDRVMPLVRLIDRNEVFTLSENDGDVKYIMPISGRESITGIDRTDITICPITDLDSPSLMSNLDGEGVFRTCARLFGPGSNAMKMYEKTNNQETLGICSLLPEIEKEKILETIKNVIDSGGRNINSILSKHVSITDDHVPQVSPEQTSFNENGAETSVPGEIPVVNLTAGEEPEVELITETVMEEKERSSDQLPANSLPESPVFTEAATPDLDARSGQEYSSSQQDMETPSVTSITPETALEMPAVQPPGIPGAEYDYNSCLITVNVSSYISGHSAPYEIHDTDRLEMHILAPENNEIIFLINVGPLRVGDFVQSIRDVCDRVTGDITTKNSTVIFKTPQNAFYTAYRGLIWSLIIEYISQIQLNVKRRTDALDFPNEGSIMLIPPGREFIRQKLPSQIMEIVEEDRIISEIETEQIQTVAKAVDTLLTRLVAPLRYGHGVALIPRKESQEMAEITLFLLLISEISGIGFSRW
ncbi:MAG: hypothetical protein ACTSP4_07480 [Candidatus Hodarchaeales archaeon]